MLELSVRSTSGRDSEVWVKGLFSERDWPLPSSTLSTLSWDREPSLVGRIGVGGGREGVVHKCHE